MSAMKAHLEKQQSNLSALLDTIEMFDFENEGIKLTETESWASLRRIGSEMDAMLNATLSTTPTPVERVSLPKFRFMRTQLDDGTVIGWDVCGFCNKHVSRCECTEPTEPKYVTKFREQDAAEAVVVVPVPVPVPIDENQLPGQITVEEAVEAATLCVDCGNETSIDAGGVEDALEGLKCASCAERSA